MQYLLSLCFILLIRLSPRSTLFPYTTLFRSWQGHRYGISSCRQTVEAIRSTGARCRCSNDIGAGGANCFNRSEEHTSELQSQSNLVCRLLLEKKKNYIVIIPQPIQLMTTFIH